MQLNAFLALTVLLATSSRAAVTRQQKEPPVHHAQVQPASAAPLSEPGQPRENRTQAAAGEAGSGSGTRTKKNDADWQQYGSDRPEEYRKFSGVRYTPLDLAEYILRTHDEEGVALAIEELLKEGLINRDEAILYLESVKKELQTLRKRFDTEVPQIDKSTSSPHRIPQLRVQSPPAYESQRKAVQTEDKRSQVPTPSEALPQVPTFHKQMPPHSLPEQHQRQQLAKAIKPVGVAEQLLTENQKQLPLQLAKLVKAKAEQERQRQPNRTSLKSAQQQSATAGNSNSNNNNRTGEQQKQDDKPGYDDYLMENVIYRLAKDMFTQSMIRDNASAEQLLSRFASFLENELADKKFNKETQNKIMDTVSAALVESLRERLYLEN